MLPYGKRYNFLRWFRHKQEQEIKEIEKTDEQELVHVFRTKKQAAARRRNKAAKQARKRNR